jgi:hypothetical protein
MKPEYKIEEIYDMLSAFVTDKGTVLTSDIKNTTKIFNLIKTLPQGDYYTIQIKQPVGKSSKFYGQIFFQDGENAPVLLTQTAYKIYANAPKIKTTFDKLLLLQYFKLINLVNQRNDKKLALTDNFVKVFDAILQFKNLQH